MSDHAAVSARAAVATAAFISNDRAVKQGCLLNLADRAAECIPTAPGRSAVRSNTSAIRSAAMSARATHPPVKQVAAESASRQSQDSLIKQRAARTAGRSAASRIVRIKHHAV
jgi:hypothetical protein